MLFKTPALFANPDAIGKERGDRACLPKGCFYLKGGWIQNGLEKTTGKESRQETKEKLTSLQQGYSLNHRIHRPALRNLGTGGPWVFPANGCDRRWFFSALIFYVSFVLRQKRQWTLFEIRSLQLRLYSILNSKSIPLFSGLIFISLYTRGFNPR